MSAARGGRRRGGRALRAAHAEAIEQAERARAEAEELQQLIVLSASAAKAKKRAGDKEAARLIERNVLDVSRGRRARSRSSCRTGA